MPYVNIKITREGATHEQKAELIAGVTDLLVCVLDKSPATTFVVIDEVDLENWGVGGLPVKEYRREHLKTAACAERPSPTRDRRLRGP
jgi:4-oxalocrotonate tautomerase